MTAPLALVAGSALTLIGWLVVRAEAGALSRLSPGLVLDALVPALGFAGLAAMTERPIFSGCLVLALCGGFAFADYCKRRAFGEPVLLADFYSTIDVLKHPSICLIFPRPILLATATILTVTGVAGLFALERPTLILPWWGLFAVLAGAVVAIRLIAGPGRQLIYAPLRTLRMTAQPRTDARRVGAFAMLLAHALLARAERARLQTATAPVPGEPAQASDGEPILLVQSESFFDPRRLHASVAREVLAAYDRCRAECVQWGSFGVPAWGANTERTEFSVLTGLAPSATGFDRFNPYRAFARQPVTSLAWRLREEGYRTICVHPFDRTFYGRDKVFANLGFDLFLGQEAFATAERGRGYIGDRQVAELMVALLKEHGPKTFIFAITMENHAPWNGARRSDRDWAPGLPPLKDEVAFANYLSGIANADAMLATLADALRAEGHGLLGFYGDHLPNLTSVFARLGFRSRRSDYLLWRAGGGTGRREDLVAHNLAEAIWRARKPPRPSPVGRNAEPVRDAVTSRVGPVPTA